MQPDGPAVKAAVDGSYAYLDWQRRAVAEALAQIKGPDWETIWEASVLTACIDGFQETGSPHLVDFFLYVHSDARIEVPEAALDLAHRAAFVRHSRDGNYPSQQKKGLDYLRKNLAQGLVRRLCEGRATLGEASKVAAAYIVAFSSSLVPLKASAVEKWCQGLPTKLRKESPPEALIKHGRQLLAYLKSELSALPMVDPGERR